MVREPRRVLTPTGERNAHKSAVLDSYVENARQVASTMERAEHALCVRAVGLRRLAQLADSLYAQVSDGRGRTVGFYDDLNEALSLVESLAREHAALRQMVGARRRAHDDILVPASNRVLVPGGVFDESDVESLDSVRRATVDDECFQASLLRVVDQFGELSDQAETGPFSRSFATAARSVKSTMERGMQFSDKQVGRLMSACNVVAARARAFIVGTESLSELSHGMYDDIERVRSAARAYAEQPSYVDVRDRVPLPAGERGVAVRELLQTLGRDSSEDGANLVPLARFDARRGRDESVRQVLYLEVFDHEAPLAPDAVAGRLHRVVDDAFSDMWRVRDDDAYSFDVTVADIERIAQASDVHAVSEELRARAQQAARLAPYVPEPASEWSMQFCP